jgi:hypothetical protein
MHVVCAADSDITLQLTNRILFKAHRKILEVHLEGFAGADAILHVFGDEVGPVGTTSVLNLHFQRLYRGTQPN